MASKPDALAILSHAMRAQLDPSSNRQNVFDPAAEAEQVERDRFYDDLQAAAGSGCVIARPAPVPGSRAALDLAQLRRATAQFDADVAAHEAGGIELVASPFGLRDRDVLRAELRRRASSVHAQR